MNEARYGVVEHNNGKRRTDYLYRISLKAMIYNERGGVLVVKEAGRKYWDLPGGGMDHGETLASSLARELEEEVLLKSPIQEYAVVAVDEPALLEHGFWQVRLIVRVTTEQADFAAGEDGDAVRFIDPMELKDSPNEVERRIYRYNLAA